MDVPNPRILGPADARLFARLVRFGWGTKVPWNYFERAVEENGTVGLLMWDNTVQVGVAALLCDLYHRYVPVWVARPGYEDALPSLFLALSEFTPPPYKINLPDVAFEGLVALKHGLPNFHVADYSSRRRFATISFDRPERPPDHSLDPEGGPVLPPDMGQAAENGGPRGLGATGVPVLLGVPREL